MPYGVALWTPEQHRARWQARVRQPHVVYRLVFARPIHHARGCYVVRRAGNPIGASKRILKAARARGITWRVTRAWTFPDAFAAFRFARDRRTSPRWMRRF
jgi:hypothetical protein